MTDKIALWWRDDDAVEDTPALRHLMQLSRRWNAPLALAVIPELAQSSLRDVARSPDIDILVHGFAHENHAHPGERKAEFTPHRRMEAMRKEWTTGYARLKDLMPETLPVFVPPWNRFPPDHMTELGRDGYRGFSAWGAESKWPAVANLIVANAHIDLIDWNGGPTAKPAETPIAELRSLAGLRRHGLDAPIGLLTHHRQMTGAALANLEKVLHFIASTPSFVWTTAQSIFRGPE